MGPRDHMQERSYLRHSLYYPWGERKLGETVVHGAKSLHTREDNIMLVMNGWRHMIFSYCSEMCYRALTCNMEILVWLYILILWKRKENKDLQ